MKNERIMPREAQKKLYALLSKLSGPVLVTVEYPLSGVAMSIEREEYGNIVFDSTTYIPPNHFIEVISVDVKVMMKMCEQWMKS